MSLRLHEPTFGEDEIAAAVAVLRSTQVTQGAKVRALEDAFAAKYGFRHAVACNSGSSANLLAIAGLVALGRLKAGDEVIVSALSWSTTVWPLVQYGLVPVFVDCDPDTLGMSVPAMTAAVTTETRAVMPVHVYGNPCAMGAIEDACDAHDLLLIEDACEAMGAFFSGRPVGSFGQAGAFSFYYSHHITTIEGGMVVTPDAELADMMRAQRAHGWTRDMRWRWPWSDGPAGIDPRFLFVTTGYNLRLNEPQAAIGLVQLGKLDGFIVRRRDNAALYRDMLEAHPGLVPQKETAGGLSSCFGQTIMVAPEAGRTRSDFKAALARQGIETRPIIAGNLAEHPGIARHPHRIAGDLECARAVLRRGFVVPNHQAMTAADIERVGTCLAAA